MLQRWVWFMHFLCVSFLTVLSDCVPIQIVSNFQELSTSSCWGGSQSSSLNECYRAIMIHVCLSCPCICNIEWWPCATVRCQEKVIWIAVFVIELCSDQRRRTMTSSMMYWGGLCWLSGWLHGWAWPSLPCHLPHHLLPHLDRCVHSNSVACFWVG
jgi:hypothetical protein